MVESLTKADSATQPRHFPMDHHLADKPGLYSWWGDEEARALLGHAVGTGQLPPLLYVGQAGATRWPSGRRSTATLESRVRRQHIRGNARSSTFRLTISSLLMTPLHLVQRPNGSL